jgi:hypothetical protein
MLTLKPPASLRNPGYPVRSHALADEDSRRRLHGILAASVLGLALGGCGGTSLQPTSGQAQPVVPVPAQQPAQPANKLAGESNLPQPAEPLQLGGKPAIPQVPAEPAGTLRGDSATPIPPPAQPEPKPQVMQPQPEPAVPRPMGGIMVAPQVPPVDPS